MKISHLALGLGLAACAGPAHKEAPVMNQSTEPAATDDLVAQLRVAVTAPIDPESLETKLGRKALINTATGYPLAGLRRVNLEPEPGHPGETLDLATARTVIYWSVPGAGDNPHVVGVQIRDDGTASVFFGIVTPP